MKEGRVCSRRELAQKEGASSLRFNRLMHSGSGKGHEERKRKTDS